MSKNYQNPQQGSAFNTEEGERDPLLAYTNPYVAPGELDAAIAAQNGNGIADNISVGSGGDQDAIDATKEKGVPGAAQSVSQTVAEAKKVAGSVIATPEDDTVWWMAPVVVGSYLFFDIAKILAEKFATHDTTLNVALLNILIMVLNMVIAYSLTTYFMGFRKGNTKLFEYELLMGYALPSAFFSISQLFNLLQNLFISPSTRKVFSQLRILLTALFSKFVMGTGYSNLQWLMIFSIVISVFQFMYLTSPDSNPMDSKDLPTGLLFSIISNVAAVLGSLLGEKHMKATKKNPFYLQKFQFEIWTFIFGLVGVVITNPLGAYMADSIGVLQEHGFAGFAQEGAVKKIISLEAKEGMKANVFGPVLKGAYFTVNDVLSKVPFEAEIEKSDSMRFGNKFNLKSWTSAQDMRMDAVSEKVLGGALASEKQQYSEGKMISTELYPLVEKYAAALYRKNNIDAEADISTWAARDKYMNGLKETGALKVHHAAKYRSLPGSLMMDTSFFTKSPLGVKADFSLRSNLQKTFSLHIGSLKEMDVEVSTSGAAGFMKCLSGAGECATETKRVSKFVPLSIYERDAPGYSAVVLKKDTKVKSVKFASEPVTTFTLIREATDEDMEVMDAATVMDMLDKAHENLEKAKAKAAGEADKVKQAELEKKNKITEKALEGFVKTDFEGAAAIEDTKTGEITTEAVPSNMNTKVEFQKKVLYVRKDKGSEITVTYSKVTTLFRSKMDSKNAAIVKTFGAAQKESSQIVIACEDVLDYGEDRETAERNIKSGEGYGAKGCKIATTLTPVGTYSAVPAIEGVAPDFSDSLPTGKGLTVEDNTEFRFKSYSDAAVKSALGPLQETAALYSYPGAVPGNACTIDLCKLTAEDEDKKLGLPGLGMGSIAGLLGIGKASNPNSQIEMTAEKYANPFSFAIVHGYSNNPIPGYFLFRATVLLAIVANAGQSWTSALLSKVLSSLWKNICAAVAMALLVFIEKILFATPAVLATTRWGHTILGSLGIITTVFIFQLAPKEKKEGH